MKRGNMPELEKPVSPQEVAKGAEEWGQLEYVERMEMLKHIRGGRKQGNEEPSE